MPRPPKVSAALVRRMRDRTTGDVIDIDMETGDVEIVARHPTGILANSLPEIWACLRPDNSIWLMRRSQEGADDVCLAVIPVAVVSKAQGSRVPLILGEVT